MRREKGQSLVEVLIALAVILVVVLALVVAVTYSIRNAAFGRNQALATKYAQENLERIRAYKEQNTWATFTANCNNASAMSLLAPPLPFNLGAINCNVISDDSREVTVVVSWVDSQGTHQSTLTTRLTNWR